jgi:hypothetical protein
MEEHSQRSRLRFNFYRNSPNGMILLDNPLLPPSLLPRIGDTLKIYLKDSHGDPRFYFLRVIGVCWNYQAETWALPRPVLETFDINCEDA